jgi:hypothetical protein
MESCINQKSVKQIQIYFRFFKEATIFLDDSFAHSRHYLNQLHLECFSTTLKDFPHMLSTCCLLFHHYAVQLIHLHLKKTFC